MMEKELLHEDPLSIFLSTFDLQNVAYYVVGSTRRIIYLSGLPIIEAVVYGPDIDPNIDDTVIASRFFPAFFHAFNEECQAVTRHEYFSSDRRKWKRPIALKYPILPFSKKFKPCNPLSEEEWMMNVVRALQACLNESIIDRLKAFSIDALLVETPHDENSHPAITKLIHGYLDKTVSPSELTHHLYKYFPDVLLDLIELDIKEPMQTCWALDLAKYMRKIEYDKGVITYLMT